MMRNLGTFSMGLCIVMLLLSLPIHAEPPIPPAAEADVATLEARLLYEGADRLAEKGDYDKALRRLNALLETYPQSPYAAQARHKQQEILTQKHQPRPLSGMSRASLVGFGTLFTIWCGIGSFILADVEDVSAYGLVFLTTPLLGLYGSLKLTEDAFLSEGQASLINLGGAWGIWQMTGAAIVADMSKKGVVAASMAGGIAGLALTTSMVRRIQVEPGQASLINVGGIWGTWLALCGGIAAGLEDRDDLLAAAMFGGNVGLVGMALLSPRWRVSRTRARLIHVGGIIGALYGVGTNLLVEPRSSRTVWAINGIGSLLGLAAGVYLTRHTDVLKDYFARETPARSGGDRREKRTAILKRGTWAANVASDWTFPLVTFSF